MQQFHELLKQIDGAIGGSQWFVFALLGVGAFFTIYLKFPQIRYFRHALRIVRGKYDKHDDQGDTTHFQALATALSGTVGTGNIAGVAFALHLGGPAALFWMVVTAALGMTTKFVEVTLSHKYREKSEDGSMAGGPMYYMKNKLKLPWLAALFAVATIISSFGTGNLPQVTSISDSLFTSFGVGRLTTGLVLGAILSVVIIGGIKRIASVTEKLVPAMATIYFIGALAVIFYNIDNVVPSIVAVFSDIFTGSAAAGGFLGSTIAFAFNRGVNRGLFSNEAGQGSAPIAHASAKAHEPVSEGMVAILEPFIDTIIVCTLTGLVLLSSGVWNEKIENQFQEGDLQILAGTMIETDATQQELLSKHILGQDTLTRFNATMTVQNGRVVSPAVTIIHARSVAEEVMITNSEGNPFSGMLKVSKGTLQQPENETVVLTGKSLIHSAPLTTEAFKRGFFGNAGQFIVSIGILLFAFSTAISWSYYGDRATTYLFGSKAVIIYRIVYVAAFVVGAVADTTLIWTLSGIAIALMTLPNLIGIVLLSGDMRQTLKDYWTDFNKEWGKKD